jgi:hypothetical protein
MTKRGKRLVVDTDVVSSAGGENATEIRSTNCRDVLKAILSASHIVVISKDIIEEWKKHQSLFAKTWLRTMFARRLVHNLNTPINEELHLKIEDLAINDKKRAAMLKDVHLIEAALLADKIIISIDRTAKGYFQEIMQEIVVLKQITWANPCIDEEEVIDWLTNGAELEEKRLLGYEVEAKVKKPISQRNQMIHDK